MRHHFDIYRWRQQYQHLDAFATLRLAVDPSLRLKSPRLRLQGVAGALSTREIPRSYFVWSDVSFLLVTTRSKSDLIDYSLSKAIRNYLADSARDRVGELDALNLFLCDVHSQVSTTEILETTSLLIACFQLDLPDPAWTTLETSLLLSMCSYDPFVRTRSKECFEMIARLSPDSRRSESNKDNLVLLAVSAASQSVKRQFRPLVSPKYQ